MGIILKRKIYDPIIYLKDEKFYPFQLYVCVYLGRDPALLV
jgi:hypothetical protein